MAEPGQNTDRATQLIQDLCADGYKLIETHISLVFVGERDVYKVKKQVDFGFLDFSTLELRHEVCKKEVELNRRLAPDVYYGVVPVTLTANGQHRLGGEGDPAEWAVHMRRLNAQHRADVLLEHKALDRQHMTQLAETLARFHEDCEASSKTASFGTAEAVRRNVLENFEQTKDLIESYIDPHAAAEIQRWQLEFLDIRQQQFAARTSDGRVRDGHGDLRLEHVYFEPTANGYSISILDCIEFNDRFRYADVCGDIAFLAMDLARAGSVALAEFFIAEYARFSNDYDLYPLINFYESYRAFVRAKVLAMTEQGRSSHQQKTELHQRARKHFLLAQASERRPVATVHVIAVGGMIASGKSTIADQLGQQLGCPVISADWTRKWLLGRQPFETVAEDAFQGAYSATITARVYREMLRRAERVLRTGRCVVFDATFRAHRQRALVRRLASELGAEFTFVECQATKEVCHQRLLAREHDQSVSDATLDIYDSFADSWESVDELPPNQHLVLDTGCSIEESVAGIRAALRP